MKFYKFLFFFLLFFVFLSAIIRYFCFPYHYRSTARHMTSMGQIQKISYRPSIDYLIVGDSYGLHALRPKALSPQSYSLSISGASALNVYYLLKRLDLKKIKKGIILTNSIYFKNHYEIDFWDRFVLLNTYSFSELISIYKDSEQQNIFPTSHYTFPGYLAKILFTKLLLNKHSVLALVSTPKDMLQRKSSRAKFEREANAENGFISYPSKIQLNDADFFQAYDEHYSKPLVISASDQIYTQKIIELAKENHLNIFFIVPPMAAKATNKDMSTFQNTYDSFYLNLEKQYPNFFVQKLNTNLTRDDFFDFIHVNINGVKKLTKDFVSAIEYLSKKADTQTVKEWEQKQEMQTPMPMQKSQSRQ